MKKRIKTEQLHIRLSDTEKQVIEKKTRDSGVISTSEYVRQMAVFGKIIRVDSKDLRELNVKIGRFGSNINQIAQRVNSTGNVYSSELNEITRDMAELKKEVEELTNLFLNIR